MTLSRLLIVMNAAQNIDPNAPMTSLDFALLSVISRVLNKFIIEEEGRRELHQNIDVNGDVNIKQSVILT